MTIAIQIDALRKMTVRQLQDKYREVFGDPTRSGNKDYLFRKIAWKIQEKAYGGLSERAKRRALEIADENDLRTRPPRGYGKMLEEQLVAGLPLAQPDLVIEAPWDPRLPQPGAIIVKEYKKRHITVIVRSAKQFEWEGRLYPSLSAIAKEITGTNYNGFTFFGLTKRERD